MAGPIAARRAKTRKGRRVILQREPKVKENPKVLACLRGHATSEKVNSVLKELHLIRKPLSKSFSRRNVIRPFEPAGEAPLEALLSKNDCSLFALGNHTKKRPDNLIIGRTFDGRVLDMVEFGIQNFTSMQDFKVRKPMLGSKPCIVFKGDFSTDESLMKVRSLFLDLFRGDEAPELDLAGVQYLVSIELLDNNNFQLRNHMVLLKKSGTRLPRVELEDIGPTLELSIRRTQFASQDLMKAALRKPRGTKARNVKNISFDKGLGDKVGQVHVERQDLGDLVIKKTKALRRKRKSSEEVGNSAEVGDAERNGDDDDDDNDVEY